MENGKKKSPIGIVVSIFLVCTAIIFDILSLVPFAGTFVAPFFWGCMTVYLYIKGYSLLNPRRLVTSGISLVAEMIPVVQELPALTVGVIVLLIMLRVENKTGIPLSGTKNSGVKANLVENGINPPRSEQAPLNMDGVRAPGGGI